MTSANKLVRQLTGLEIWASRFTNQVNGIGRNLARITEQLGIPLEPTPELTMPTGTEIDALKADGAHPTSSSHLPGVQVVRTESVGQ